MSRTFQTTVGQVIAKARAMINDSNVSAGLRQSDAELIGWINDAINVLLNLRPGLFVKNAPFTCVAGYSQMVEFSRAVGFLEVMGMPEGDRLTLTQYMPGWTISTQGEPVNWMPEPSEPLRFDVYPPAVAGSLLNVRYIESPLPLALTTDLIPLSENYEAMLVEYVAGRAEMKDDEHANSGRASLLMDRFVAQAKGTA